MVMSYAFSVAAILFWFYGPNWGHVCGCVHGRIQKFPDWQPGTRTANGTTLCY